MYFADRGCVRTWRNLYRYATNLQACVQGQWSSALSSCCLENGPKDVSNCEGLSCPRLHHFTPKFLKNFCNSPSGCLCGGHRFAGNFYWTRPKKEGGVGLPLFCLDSRNLPIEVSSNLLGLIMPAVFMKFSFYSAVKCLKCAVIFYFKHMFLIDWLIDWLIDVLISRVSNLHACSW